MQIPVFDCHADTPFELWRKNEPLRQNSCHIDLQRIKEFPNYAQFFAYCTYSQGITLDNRFWSPEQLYSRPKTIMEKELNKYADEMRLCRNADELHRAWESGKAAAFYTLEGAEGIKCDPEKLDSLFDDGVRMVSLTWNADNALAGFHGTNSPLTALGKDFVKKAQSRGMIIDVSHSSDQTIYDILDITTMPIIASHSNSRAICGNSRNLSDELFILISRCGGLAGINLYSTFLCDGTATFDSVYAHIDHFLELSGEEHVALGGDLDGCDTLPEGFSGIDSYSSLGDFLLTKYPQQVVEKLFFGNVLRVLEACCK